MASQNLRETMRADMDVPVMGMNTGMAEAMRIPAPCSCSGNAAVGCITVPSIRRT